jgi:colanic acid/amylovoran biosynthesis protein
MHVASKNSYSPTSQAETGEDCQGLAACRRVCLLGATFANDNLGVGALAAGSVTGLLDAGNGSEVSLLGYSREPGPQPFGWGERMVWLPVIRLRKKGALGHNIYLLLVLAVLWRLAPGDAAKRWWAGRNPVLRELAEQDAALSIAGGDSFSDIYGLRVLVDVCLPQMLALLMRRRLIQLPQTIGPFNTRIGRWLGSQILRRSSVILSRDLESIAQLKRLPGGAALAELASFCWDVGFLVEPAAGQSVVIEGLDVEKEHSGLLVGLNVSGLLHEGGLRGQDEFKCREAYRQLCARMISSFVEQGARVVLIPHVHGEYISKDTWICRQLYEEYSARWPGRVGFAKGRYTTAEIKPLLGRCDLVVAGRMHACIGALSMGTPAVGVAYSRKFKGVFESLGLGEWVIDPRTMGVEEMLETLGECLAKRAEIETRLADVMPKVKNEIVGKIAAAVQDEGDGRN